MLTIEGIYKNGTVILEEQPQGVEESKVLVTFLNVREISLTERGVSPEQAAVLRAKFDTIAEDWERPEMDVYDVD